MKILVTGAKGFVGRNFVERFHASNIEVVAAVRTPSKLPCNEVVVGDIDDATRWNDALSGVDTIVHLAARVHVMNESASDPLSEFRRVNVAGSINLACQAANTGVRRLVFVSTVKVLGEETEDEPFNDASPCKPTDDYAVSKYEAEEKLFEIGKKTGMEIVVLRPPLVYGPGVGGNFFRLLRLSSLSIPLPLGGVDNRRSMIYLDNLIDALYLCLSVSLPANRAFLVCDAVSLSTGELIRRLKSCMGKIPFLWHVPESVLLWVARFLGFGKEISRMTSSLEIDDSHFRAVSGWRPPVSVDDGLKKTASWYLKEIRKK